jgi:hypothetical protein
MAAEKYDIKILKNGTWLYAGTPIRRENMVKLFSSVLKKDKKGGYWLETPYEKGRIEVEDAPFTAVELKAKGRGKKQTLSFRTNTDHWVTAGKGHDIRVETNRKTGEPAPYIHVRDGLEARIARAVFYELAHLAVSDGKDGYGVWSGGSFYIIGRK